MNEMDNRLGHASRVTWVGLIWNVVLTALKFWIGFWGKSSALVADAIHSLSDFSTDIAVLTGLRIASKPVDTNHHYGHGKFETLSTIFIGFSLFIVGIGLLWSGSKTIYETFLGQPLPAPGKWTLLAAGISIIVKEGLYQYTARAGKKYQSQPLIANAWHHRTDALSSVGVLAGISGAIFLGDQWTVLDPIAAVLVSILILQVSFTTAREAVDELMEASLSDKGNAEIIEIVKNVSGVINPHNLKTRKIGSTIAIDMHIKVDPKLTIVEAHDIATKVELQIKEIHGQQTFTSIHVEPNLQDRF
jgi:cation diffusion facilitator family transporter